MLLTLVLHVHGLLPPSDQPRFTRMAVLRSTATAAAAHAAIASAARAIPPLPDAQAANVLYTPPGVKGLSTPEQLALAEHLGRKGAKFYGAYWCSFCLRQRQMFGAGGSRALPYIECAEDGYGRQSCPRQVDGYPTWEIDGKFYGGMRTLRDLQALSGFDAAVQFPEYVPPPPPPRPPPPPGGYKPLAVTVASTPEQLALAEHLKASGAKFYGACARGRPKPRLRWARPQVAACAPPARQPARSLTGGAPDARRTDWCKFCGLQRTLFGATGTAALPYVECASDGYQSAAGECKAKTVQAFPTWEIGGKFYSGYQSLDELARLSGFQARPASKIARADDLGIDFSAAAPKTVRSGDDCTLADGGVDCK